MPDKSLRVDIPLNAGLIKRTVVHDGFVERISSNTFALLGAGFILAKSGLLRCRVG